MKKLLMLVLLALAALPMSAGADDKTKMGTMGGKPYFEASDVVTAHATILKVDKATRDVTLRGEHGDTLKVRCGDQVKNFAQLKVGDTVKFTYTEKLSIHVETGGSPEMTTETTTGGAKPGEKPAGSVTERTQYKATITAIDKTKGTATLKGYDGEEFTVTPLHPENLSKVAIGDLVVFTQTSAIAASVEKVAAKK